MKILGLTGGIGSGKSVVAELLQLMGVPVYDSDERTKTLYDTDEDLKKALVKLFGESVYEGGQLNRQKLADCIFSDSAALYAVNALVHPIVDRDFRNWAMTHQTASLIVQETAILFESGLSEQYDAIVCVSAPEALRISRVCQRSGMTSEAVLDRMKNQLSEEERLLRSDFIIVNDEIQALIPQVIHILNVLESFNKIN